MDVEDEPPTSNFQFDTEKVKAGDSILGEPKRKKGNPVHYIIIINILATKELKIHFLKETGARDCPLTDKTDSVSKTEVEMRLQPLTGRTTRLAEQLTFGVDKLI